MLADVTVPLEDGLAEGLPGGALAAEAAHAATLRGMDAVWAFFSTFEPKDWVTAALAVGASVLSGIAISQNARHFPKPVVEARLWFRPALPLGDKVDMVVHSIANHGNANMEDVWVLLFHSDKPKARLSIQRGETIKPGESIESKSGPTGKLRKERLEITWRQAPNMKKIRRLTLKVERIPKDWEDRIKPPLPEEPQP